MDYEQKYNDALERAKQMCATPTDKATMEFIFPDLRESYNHEYDGNMDKECIELCDTLNKLPGVKTFESCCGHLKDRYSIWFFCEDIDTISRLGRSVDRNYSDGKWEIIVDSTDTNPRGVFWLRSKTIFASYGQMNESTQRLAESILHWFNSDFDSYFRESESKDESTRKALIETVKCIAAGDTMFLSEQQKERYITWLEEQKESLHIPESCKENGDSFTNDEPSPCEILDEQGRVIATQQKEQKPAEWSEEDEKVIKLIESSTWDGEKLTQGEAGAVLRWLKDLPNRFSLRPQPKVEWSEEDERWMKLAINSCEMCGNPFTASWLKSLRPQPKQEWSEEDEKIYDKALDAVYYQDCNDKQDVLYALKGLCDLISKKRKVIPVYQRWKPSEEQMKALQHAIDACESEWAYQDDELRSLLNDLKKL